MVFLPVGALLLASTLLIACIGLGSLIIAVSRALDERKRSAASTTVERSKSSDDFPRAA
jgi:hypothetical protein